ncbi:MAG: diphosphate--fructose-6-phosphate 1-phosphotransferase [Lentisphaeria bacterium]|nr:diphosphate--fructose-6-phosphate 1-phosphotransferase [Lentisphaeria bacterium]
MSISPLQDARAAYQPKLPAVFANRDGAFSTSQGEPTQSVADQVKIKAKFAHTYGLPELTFVPGEKGDSDVLKAGVILSGGQAPGGHNVIAGLYDGLKDLNPVSELYGFRGGPSGLLDNDHVLFTDGMIDAYRNTGGFDIIGSGRTKLESEEQFAQVAANCGELGINAVVVIGGDDSNTNACLLAEYFCREAIDIQVIGCPKTIDGDLKNDHIATSFGFDTATKVYSELIGNIQRDANSAKKYWHFVKLMGRSASHIGLECALKTHPNVAIISEEIAAKASTLQDVVTYLADIVCQRAAIGKNFGVALIPEGLIEFIPAIKALIAELNDLLADNAVYFETLDTDDDRLQFVNSHLSAATSQAFSSLPMTIQLQLMADRDPHGNVQVSKIETEKLLVEMVESRLQEWKAKGKYTGKFAAQTHFFGYEGRCAAPSNFDADYCYGLGYTAAALISSGVTGYMSCLQGLTKPAAEWRAGGVPLTMMMNVERRKGHDHPVIKKALVETDSPAFKEFAANRDKWAMDDDYQYPGPIQYFGPSEVCDLTTVTLAIEANQ